MVPRTCNYVDSRRRGRIVRAACCVGPRYGNGGFERVMGCLAARWRIAMDPRSCVLPVQRCKMADSGLPSFGLRLPTTQLDKEGGRDDKNVSQKNKNKFCSVRWRSMVFYSCVMGTVRYFGVACSLRLYRLACCCRRVSDDWSFQIVWI